MNDHHNHNHNHSHHHGHNHNHHSAGPTADFQQAFLIGIILNVGFVIIEAGFGFVTNSLALLADAGHNLSDVVSLLLAWGASYLTKLPPSQRYTYGWRRSSILASLLSSMLLMLAMGVITWEALQQIQNPRPVPGITLIWVAAIGVVINTLTAWLFMKGRQDDLNIRAAFWHMAADALVSLGVVLAGIAILNTGWLWFDPLISLVIVAVVVIGTWDLLKDALNLSLDGVPEQIEPLAVRMFLTEIPEVTRIHDLHIWAMSTTETALTVHLVMPEGHPGDDFLTRITEHLRQQFGIAHTTIQIEIGNGQEPCCLESEYLV